MRDFILTRTPHRVSFFGGGSDIKNFYKKYEGACLSTAIKYYVYVGVKKHSKFFNEKYRIVYSDTELKNKISNIDNDIVRETLKHCKYKEPIYINSISDLPACSGLGSSSAFTVGLLKAVYYLMGIKKTNIQLAEEACEIEIKKIKKPIGKQDQYSCSLGGINFFKFHSSNLVSFEKKLKVNKFINKVLSDSLLIWTGISRKSEIILKKQNQDLKKGLINEKMLKIKSICENFYNEVCQYDGKNFKYLNEFFIESLNESWMIKKSINNKMTNNKIDMIIKLVKSNVRNNLGIKLLGAGAGGFVLVTGINNISLIQKKLSKKKIFSLKIYNDKKGSVIL